MHARHAYPNQPVLGLELPLRRLVVVDQAEASAPSTTEGGLQAKGDYAQLVGLVDGREALRELRLGDIRAVGVKDIDDELAARQEAVRDELARADGHRC